MSNNSNYNLFIANMKLNDPAGWKAVQFFQLIIKKCLMLDMSSSLQAIGSFQTLLRLVLASISLSSCPTEEEEDQDAVRHWRRP